MKAAVTCVRRALDNLIGNALKYGAPDTPVRIACTSEHERVLLSVHDEGDPLPADRNPAQGWGIGLPYVRPFLDAPTL